MDNELGLLIEAKRKELQLTRVQLAVQCYVTEQTIYKIEMGERNPSINVLKAIFTELDLLEYFDHFRWRLENY